MLTETDFVATLPRRFSFRAAESHRLSLLDLPFEPLNVDIEAAVHGGMLEPSGSFES